MVRFGLSSLRHIFSPTKHVFTNGNRQQREETNKRESLKMASFLKHLALFSLKEPSYVSKRGNFLSFSHTFLASKQSQLKKKTQN